MKKLSQTQFYKLIVRHPGLSAHQWQLWLGRDMSSQLLKLTKKGKVTRKRGLDTSQLLTAYLYYSEGGKENDNRQKV